MHSQAMAHTRALFAALVLLAGCTTEPERSWVGTWTLVSVNGAPLPYSFSISGYPAVVAGGSLVVNANHTATATYSVSSGVWCVPQSSDTMCAEPNGPTVTLTWTTSGDQLLTTAVAFGVAYSTFTRVDNSTITCVGVDGTETYRR
jgi:hypothetical protein